ncbi:MAG: PAS domain-containing protein, partial [Alsobacter sp.]
MTRLPLKPTLTVLFLATLVLAGAEAWQALNGGLTPVSAASLFGAQAACIAAAMLLLQVRLLRPVGLLAAASGGASGDVTALASSIEAIRSGSNDANRATAALNSAPTNVMLIDKDYRIVFMNKAVRQLFRAHVPDFRTSFPNFDPEQILGQSMGIFHKNPAHQERMVERMTQPHVARIKMGTRVFDLVVTPVSNDEGERLGGMLEWRDMTAEIAIQDEVAAVARGAAEGDFSRRIPLAGKTGFMHD